MNLKAKIPAWLICILILASSCSSKTNSAKNTTSNTPETTQMLPDTAGLWKDIENLQPQKSNELNLKGTYRLLTLDFNGMKKKLLAAPKENNKQTTPGAVVNIPMPEGTYQAFSVYETEVMAPELAAKFPEIKTYSGNGITDRTSGIRLDFNPNGFHAMLITLKGSIIIDPKDRNDNTKYICYYKEGLSHDSRHPYETDTIK